MFTVIFKIPQDSQIHLKKQSEKQFCKDLYYDPMVMILQVFEGVPEICIWVT